MSIAFTNGDSGGIDFGDLNVFRDRNPFTCCIWIYPTGWGANNYGRLPCKENATGPAGWTWFLANAGGALGVESIAFLRWRATIDTELRAADYSITLNEWQHVAIRYNSTDPQLFINGVEVSYLVENAGSGAESTDVGANFKTANRTALDRDFGGSQEDMRLYNRYLSDTELAAIYIGNGHDGIVDGLVARWPMNEKALGQTISTSPIRNVMHNDDGTTDYASTPYGEGRIIQRRRLA